eukprot:4782255-Prymnesium_polylepis.1
MQGGSPFRSAEPAAFNAHAPYAMTKGGPPSPCCRILLMPSQKLEKERCAFMKVVAGVCVPREQRGQRRRARPRVAEQLGGRGALGALVAQPLLCRLHVARGVQLGVSEGARRRIAPLALQVGATGRQLLVPRLQEVRRGLRVAPALCGRVPQPQRTNGCDGGAVVTMQLLLLLLLSQIGAGSWLSVRVGENRELSLAWVQTHDLHRHPAVTACRRQHLVEHLVLILRRQRVQLRKRRDRHTVVTATRVDQALAQLVDAQQPAARHLTTPRSVPLCHVPGVRGGSGGPALSAQEQPRGHSVRLE